MFNATKPDHNQGWIAFGGNSGMAGCVSFHVWRWTEAIFAKLFAMLAPGGVLVTYCSKSVARKSLQAVGFEVEKLPGPPGKREMIRAKK